MSKYVKEIMRQVFTINKDKTFVEALTMMVQEKTNSVVVVDDDGKMVGLLNTGMLIKQVIPDYLEKDAIAAHFANEEIFAEEVEKSKDVLVEKIMLANPKFVKDDAHLMEVSIIAISKDQLRIPVLDEENRPVGIITRTELKKFFAGILRVDEE
jgi:CBS domain-containing protein